MKVRKRRPLDVILATGHDMPVEQLVEVTHSLRTLIALQEFPDITAIRLTGISLPPHERTMLYQLEWGARNTVVVGSRGTSKSFTVCVLHPTLRALVRPHRRMVTLSATGFRGGQSIFLDIERWVRGGLDSQLPEVPFLKGSIARPQILNKSQSFWTIEFDSFALQTTLPTNDGQKIRGQRGHELRVDEANSIDRELIDKVAMPFLNVKGDFRHGGQHADANQVIFTSTIDYNWRPFQDLIKAARDGVYRDLQASRATGEDFERLESSQGGLNNYSYMQFDYTDLLIRRRLTNRRGQQFEVQWPNPDIELTEDRLGIPFSQRDDKGYIDKEGSALEYYSTYPVEKEGLELPLIDGSVDEATWLAEQRNIVDSAMGDVYSHDLVDRVSCNGAHAIMPYQSMSKEWQGRYADGELDYVAPVLWRCTDPCVLGVDFAPQSDFCAFVVIRVGPCATGDYDAFTHQGKSAWSNVIWAEQHRQMSAEDMAIKIRALAERYNLIWYHDPNVLDKWEACRAIGLDMRGGGSATRDELCFINEEQPPVDQYRIYDPLDKDERILKFVTDAKARPMLDTIWPTDQLNDKLVEFTKGQMQQGFLYIGKFFPQSDRPKGQRELNIGYDAMLTLAAQLRKLRQEPTKNFRHFYMEGNTDKDKNKKDMWAAFIYAAKQARAHIIRQRLIDNTPPPMGVAVVRVGSKRGQSGHSPGSKRW